MIRSPIHRVLFTFRRHRVRALLMGGQACVLYGAAEFTRDSDFLVSVDEANLARLRAALTELEARRVYVPDLDAGALLRGHACHFRCGARGVEDWRIDLMATLRGCAPFEELWARHAEAQVPPGGRVATLAVADLVAAKKTQRDKDWPMIARLVEADFIRAGKRPPPRQIEFWLMEARTSDLLLRLVRRFRGAAARIAPRRRAVAAALRSDLRSIDRALEREQRREREADRAYWKPLRDELQRWRRTRARRTHR